MGVQEGWVSLLVGVVHSLTVLLRLCGGAGGMGLCAGGGGAFPDCPPETVGGGGGGGGRRDGSLCWWVWCTP